MNNKITPLPNGDFVVDYDNSLGKAIEFHSDKGYTESTKERYEEFARKRYEWDNWKPIKDL